MEMFDINTGALVETFDNVSIGGWSVMEDHLFTLGHAEPLYNTSDPPPAGVRNPDADGILTCDLNFALHPGLCSNCYSNETEKAILDMCCTEAESCEHQNYRNMRKRLTELAIVSMVELETGNTVGTFNISNLDMNIDDTFGSMFVSDAHLFLALNHRSKNFFSYYSDVGLVNTHSDQRLHRPASGNRDQHRRV